MRALLYGASGGLAGSLAKALAARDWQVDPVTRHGGERYSDHRPPGQYDAYVFPQALFVKRPLPETTAQEIDDSLSVGLGDIIKSVSRILGDGFDPARRTDFVFIGSTSAYAGFSQTAVYCAVKHGLLGFVRAMNDEYAATGARFWLFSMGTMDTAMGRLLTDQDESSFLPPEEVAERIVQAFTSPSNLFEPEVIIRRRVVRMKEG